VRRLLLLLALAPLPASAQLVGDVAACRSGGPAIQANITGLKDRTGTLLLELYPANEADFLAKDSDLRGAGKTFRRVHADLPASGAVSVCIRVPAAGTYALFLQHDRDGKNKFNFWSDGAGLPSNRRIGRAKPTLANARVTVGAGVTAVPITAQYLRGFPPSFGPLGGR
jgi:uncharacterized protein (DUF2141 family)